MSHEIKKIAFYLPQFHEIPENNEWWGKGFTEWTNVKYAKQLFNQHYQPREPLNNNYYDLADQSTLIEHAKLASEYGLDGFCYYHYWFNGKKLLEKPIENMLKNPSVNISFCLSWANEPWTRAWDGGEKEILMPQLYGDEKDWLEHINYLIPFFQDNRYIKINNRPVFLIYRTLSFKKFDEMILFWNHILKEHGLENIYLIETLNSYQSKPSCLQSEAVLEFEPMFTIGNSRFFRILNKPFKYITGVNGAVYSYDLVWKYILNRKVKRFDGKKHNLGAFVDWDNSPRRKKNCTIFIGSSPQKFSEYFNKLVEKAKKTESNFIFINAWNEWAEGTYLEPDKKYGFDYLNAIKKSSLDKLRKQ